VSTPLHCASLEPAAAAASIMANLLRSVAIVGAGARRRPRGWPGLAPVASAPPPSPPRVPPGLAHASAMGLGPISPLPDLRPDRRAHEG
jgi:hypothetical protein